MTYEVPQVPGEPAEPDTPSVSRPEGYPMWEVFVRQRRGLSHVHAGSIRAPDAETALQGARDVYTRRTEGLSVWVVPSSEVVAFDPDDAADYLEASDKPYRHATHYQIPDDVGHM